MNNLTNRRMMMQAAVSAAAAGTLVSYSHADQAAPLTSIQLPRGTKTEKGRWSFPIKVLAADDFSPVAGVKVEFNWWGTDGGILLFETDENGQFTYEANGQEQELYMMIFKAPDHSRFASSGCGFGGFSSDRYPLTIQPDGTYFPNIVLLPFHETTHEALKPYAVSRKK